MVALPVNKQDIIGNVDALAKVYFTKNRIEMINQIRNTQISGRLTALAMYLPGGWIFVFEDGLVIPNRIPKSDGI